MATVSDGQAQFVLNNGVAMPALGLGTWQLHARQPILTALQAGYRLIDTASIYRNESEVGQALQKSGVPRSEVFLSTKVWDTDHGYRRTLRAFDASLKRLEVETVDLYLIHWPHNRKLDETWQALEEVYAQGRARAIGVSNYRLEHLEGLFQTCQVVPAVNQIELNPFNYARQRKLAEACMAEGIQLMAYSPLNRGRGLSNPLLVEISEWYGKSPAQVVIRWALQHGFVVIPKSSLAEHIRANLDVFDFAIADEDMDQLDGLGAGG